MEAFMSFRYLFAETLEGYNVVRRGGTYGICTRVRGFADRCVATPPRRRTAIL